MEDQTVPHPKRFPDGGEGARVLPLANGRHVQMYLADEDDTDMIAYEESVRAYSDF